MFGGNSTGRYQSLGFITDGMLSTTGELELPTQVGGYIAYRHFWTTTVRSSLVLSAARADNPSGTFGGLNRSDRSAHVNLVWNPVPMVTLGVEYITARRELENGQSGTLR